MSEEAGFLSAIVAEPDDDTHRLVFADWLDDHDQPDRAAFIRAQVKLARSEPGDEGYDELKLQERRLLGRHSEAWLEPIRQWLPPNFRQYGCYGIFRRGFVETAIVAARPLLADPDGLFAAAPVSGLVLWDSLSPELLACPALGRVERLQLHEECDNYDYSHLAAARHLGTLRELDLSARHIQAEALADLVASASWAGLESLELQAVYLDEAGFRAVGSALALPRLRRLRADCNGFGPLDEWLVGDWPRRLQDLDVGSSNLDSAETVALFGKGDWPALERLSLCGIGGADSGGRLAAALRAMPRLRTLDLSQRHFEEPLRALTQGAGFAALHSLDISGGRQHDTAGLFPTEAFPNLRDLDVRGNNLAGQLAGLADSPLTRTLRRLALSGCCLGSEEVAAFARSARLPQLETLRLGESSVFTPKTLAELSFAESAPRLRTLHLTLPDQAQMYAALASAPALRQVQYLYLSGDLGSKLVDLLLAHPGFQELKGLGFAVSSLDAEDRARLRDHFGDRFLG